MLDKKTLKNELAELGICQGMNLLVHSSLRKVGKVEDGADGIIDTLLELLGPDGTLMMSTVSGNVYPEQPVFHVEYTPSTVGVLGNVFRKRPGAIRSLHPVHSIAAMGPKAEFFTSGHLEANTPWSPDSPYGKLMRNNGYALFLGTDFSANTCLHALEIEARVPGLHTPNTSTLYICDYENKWRTIEHHWHAPKRAHYIEMQKVTESAGGLKYGKTGDTTSILCDTAVLRSAILPILQNNSAAVIEPQSDNDFIWE